MILRVPRPCRPAALHRKRRPLHRRPSRHRRRHPPCRRPERPLIRAGPPVSPSPGLRLPLPLLTDPRKVTPLTLSRDHHHHPRELPSSTPSNGLRKGRLRRNRRRRIPPRERRRRPLPPLNLKCTRSPSITTNTECRRLLVNRIPSNILSNNRNNNNSNSPVLMRQLPVTANIPKCTNNRTAVIRVFRR